MADFYHDAQPFTRGSVTTFANMWGPDFIVRTGLLNGGITF